MSEHPDWSALATLYLLPDKGNGREYHLEVAEIETDFELLSICRALCEGTSGILAEVMKHQLRRIVGLDEDEEEEDLCTSESIQA